MSTKIHLCINDGRHLAEFIRLNEQWISEYFELEQIDRELAANPCRIVDAGGYIFSIVMGTDVIGVCALFRDSAECYQLARMAVSREHRGNGYGDILLTAALQKATEMGARRIYLYSNTKLTPAISLYRKHGFGVLSEGQHPKYARCNIVMERQF